MNCKNVIETLPDYMDGQLDNAAVEAVKGHISECGTCAEQLRSLVALSEALKGLEPVKAPADFTHRLKERIDARPKSYFGLIPLTIKIPAGVAALVVTAVIAVYVFKAEQVGTPLITWKKGEMAAVPSTSDTHDKLTVEKSINPAAPAAIKKPTPTHKVQIQAKAKRAAQKPTQKPAQEPVLIALLIKLPTTAPAESAAAGGVQADRAMSAMPEISPMPEMAAKKSAPAARHVEPLAAALSKIVAFLPELNAHVVAPQDGHRLTIDIPSDNYDTLLVRLESIGTYNKPPPRPVGAKTIRVQIQIAAE
ncbi:anti-sigma factor family protein [Candidatus Magnetominusculus dajiuhuensis]|uniref:anti-sigma factor family protein n=1 Tax=Candidatus Magnetominusculus dajiuhuensis TaxID=3137712 RepID=UPI003B42D6C0